MKCWRKESIRRRRSDNSVWNLEMMERLIDFVEKDDRCKKYRGLDWSLELGVSKG